MLGVRLSTERFGELWSPHRVSLGYARRILLFHFSIENEST
jgi:hypothetical protein